MQAYVPDASAPNERAKGLGWLSAATSLGAVVGPALGALLVQLTNSYSYLASRLEYSRSLTSG